MESAGQEVQKPKRPKQVLYAVYLIYGSIAINILTLIFNTTTIFSRLCPTVFIGSLAVLYGLSIWVTIKIAVGRTWARFLYLAWVILGLYGLIDLAKNIADDPLPWSLAGISTILGLIALILLFKRPSNAWFKQTKTG